MSDGPSIQLQGVSLDRRAPLRDQIYQLVRSLIIIGQLRPGQPVNEIEIAEQLGVSRTPVREAVKRISDEGLINVFAQNGTFVTEISRKALEEAYIIRNALEMESVRRAAGQMTTREHEEALEDIIALHETAIMRRRFADAIRLDDQFHRYIAEINGLSMLWRAVDISKAQMDRGRYRALPSPGSGETTILQHRNILAALHAQDPQQAMEAMRLHLDTSLRNTLSLLGDNLD
ncbi:GntR family transcriptional regulator [Labrys monachus]|uniref:DNA-binding GntR family transcriptional regulator n=1 Tax=Labrys monachus TaxID=217067 RepID=A0ABU0FBP1_9HYPH|nr:GntR family transcriptional regulator [Labrys monachus]MDQ0391971.1 DNA-binding GntR family transcriptional regulator [Labrys monachus]